MKTIKSQSRMLEDLINEISNSHSKKELLDVICHTLKKYIHFDDSFILLYNKEKKTCRTFLYHVEERRSKRPEFEDQIEIEYSIENLEQQNEIPTVQDVETLHKAGITEVDFIRKAGIKEFVNLKLYDKNEFIGLFVLLSDSKGLFTSDSLSLLKNISYQVAAATLNIIAHEKINKRDEEKNVLHALTIEIARVRNRSDLHEVLNATFKKVFLIQEYALSKISDDGKTYDNFILDAKEITRSHVNFDKIVNSQYSVNDPLFSQVMQTNYSIIFNINEIAEVPGMPEYVGFWHSLGVKSIVAIALRASGKDIGCAYFSFESEQFDYTKKNLIEVIASQLSLTMSNILANEEIEKREEEKSILLSLSNELSVIKNRNDLLNIVNIRIKKLFSIKELGIAKIDDNGKTYSAFMMDLNENITNDAEFEATTSITYDINDPLFGKLMNQNDPVIFQVNEIVNNPEMPGFVHFWKKMGLEQVLCASMRAGGRNIGMLVLHIDTNKTLSVKNTLLKGVCAQLSVAISNIIAGEEIKKREWERNQLLQLNMDLASVRTNEDLMIVITKKLKKILLFSHAHLTRINEDATTVTPYLYDPDSKSKDHPLYGTLKGSKIHIDDGILNKSMATPEPTIVDFDQLEMEQELPLYARVNFESGIKQLITTRFTSGDRIFGFWMLFFDKKIILDPHKSSLIKGISDQMSIAIANIIAEEEIKKREYERNTLLLLNMDLAAVRTNEDLMFVITEKLKKILHFSHAHLVRINDDRVSVTPYLYDAHSRSQNHPLYSKLKGNKFLIEDGILNKSIITADPTIIDFDQLEKEQELPLYGIINYESGIQQVVTTRFIIGDQVFGFWMMFFDKKISLDAHQSSLIKGISDQMSIAIANIFAIQEIEVREKEKSMLLDLSNNIAKVRNKNDLRQIVDEKLKTLLVFNNISFCYVSPDGKTFGSFILDPNSPSVKHPEYGDITARLHPVNDGIINKVLASEDPLVYDMETYIESNDKVPDYFRMIYDVGMRQMIFSRLQNGENTIGYLAITKKVKMHIDSNQLNLIKAISAQLSVALANINANEQIENQIKEIKKYKNQLEEENSYLLEEINNSFSHSDIISVSGEMKKVFHLVQQGAPSDSTVLLLGETGTGKELIARAIHNSSPRFNKLMVKVNCAALPVNLIESELFGHERGSFTGAIERRIGKFELANNGTLFLDEIGEMPLELQVKLLRALQEKEIERLGGKATIKVDVRIIAATNRNLEKLMEEGKFRSDLYYRLNIFPINLPPLRDRKEDIPVLASHFIKMYSKKTGKKITNLSSKALQEMMQYNWPGNIRELEHLIERSVLLNTGETLKGIVLPVKNSSTVFKEEDTLDIKTIDENERAYIMKILKYTNGRIAGFGGAAELLGIPPTTLHSRMKRLGIKKEHLSSGKQ